MTTRQDPEELLTVGQVAGRFGVTVRTLHHYDSIGLVVPGERSHAGYRLYTSADLRRLAQVVMLRRLELPLDEIGAALQGDVTGRLERHRGVVIARLEQLQRLLEGIDTALEIEMRDYAVPTSELKKLFGDSYDESYDTEARERWGDTEAWQESRRRTKEYGLEEWERIKAESDAIMERFAAAKRAGCDPAADEARAAVQAHRDHIETWFNPVPLPMLAGMGQMYRDDPRFAAPYDAVEPGLAAFVAAAVAAYCEAEV